MAFVRKQGHLYSENGWRMCDADELDFEPVPDVGWKVGVRKGPPNTILKALMTRLHREVEPLDPTQSGVFTETNSMPNSNHNSGTALDWRWRDHPFHAWGTWGANRGKVDKIISDFRGTVEWGGNWTQPRDEMHFELHFGEGHAGTEQLAKELRDGLWGIFGAGESPTGPVNDEDWIQIGDTGPHIRVLQAELNQVFPRYKDTPLVTDGEYGKATESAVREFQTRASIGVDGIVGPITRAEFAKHGVRLDRPVDMPEDISDRELLEQIWEQLRGAGGKGWEQLGRNDKGDNLTLVDAIAVIKTKVLNA